MEQEDAVAVVEAWQAAANSGDVDALLTLSAADIAIVGPRGTATGHQILIDWLARAGLQLQSLQTFARGAAVVVAQHGVWHAPDSGAVVGERDIATYYRVVGAQVVFLARYDTLAEALAAADLDDTAKK